MNRSKRFSFHFQACFLAAYSLWISPRFPIAAQTQRKPIAAAAAGHGNSAFIPPPGPASAAQARGLDVRIPLQDKSVRFAVIGDSGTGEREQYEVARQMVAYWQATKFNFVIMLGDNIYGGHSPRDFARK